MNLTYSLTRWLLLFILSGAAAFATGGFPQSYSIDELDHPKRGEYRYVYRVFFKLYDAAFFVAPSASAEDIRNATVPFHLSFNYLRTIDKPIILKSADQMLARNLSQEERALIAERVDQLNAAYQTVNEGDRSSLTYSPSRGTTLKINGNEVITIEGQDFAKHYFTIWLGEQPISTSMKDALLSK